MFMNRNLLSLIAKNKDEKNLVHLTDLYKYMVCRTKNET